MELRNIHLNCARGIVYAELYDENGALTFSATLEYILQMIDERGYKVKGVSESPLRMR